ncbi:MAG: sulfatase [Rikenellaceae bacterium]
MREILKYTPFIASIFTHYGASALDRPNIVCIVSEDNSKEYMSLFCEGRGTVSPAVERLAAEGVLFENASSNAPVSSAARSTLISGCYANRLGCHYHRAEEMVEMPDGLKMFPAYLREAGYYTVNNAKEDYNITKGEGVWDESSRRASWRNRAAGQPFYYVHNLGDTHEGQMKRSTDKLVEEVGDYQPAAGVYVQPNFPDTELFRLSYRFYCKRIEQMDTKVAAVVAELEKDGLLDDTIILYYGDNGGIMPNSKGFLTEMGLNVPLIVRVPKKYKSMIDVERGSRDQRFVGFYDLAPTILEMAGVAIPEQMDGESIWSKKQDDKGAVLYGYADRMGEKYDMVRSVRKGNYKYVRSFQPFNFDALSNDYRSTMPIYQELRALYGAGALNDLQSQFFRPKRAELLYDLSQDPYELENLADDSSLQSVRDDLREEMDRWMVESLDIGLLPEFYWIREAGAATVAYTKRSSSRIVDYLKIANLQIARYNEPKIREALVSQDPIKRYWGVIVCSSFGREAAALLPIIRQISKSDVEPTNRVRAAEYLALCGYDSPQKVMCEALYSVSDPVEATLILNSMTLLSEGAQREVFTIDASKLSPTLKSHTLVKSALKKHNLINENH